MSLDPGTRLGPYQIVSAIDAGGMGAVYRARDARLDRCWPRSIAAIQGFEDSRDVRASQAVQFRWTIVVVGLCRVSVDR